MIASFGLQRVEVVLDAQVSLSIAGHGFQVPLTGKVEVRAELRVDVSTYEQELGHWDPPPVPLTSPPQYLEGGQWKPCAWVVDQVLVLPTIPQQPPRPRVLHDAGLTVLEPVSVQLEGEGGLADQLLRHPSLRAGQFWSALGGLDLAGAASAAAAGDLDDAWQGLTGDLSLEDAGLPAAVLDPLQESLHASFEAALAAGRAALDGTLQQGIAASVSTLRAALISLAEQAIEALEQELFEAAALVKLVAALAAENPGAALRAAFEWLVERLLAPFSGPLAALQAQLDWLLQALQWLLDWARAALLLGPGAVMDGLARLVAASAPRWEQLRDRVEPVVTSTLQSLQLTPLGRASFASDLLEAVLDQPAIGALLAQVG